MVESRLARIDLHLFSAHICDCLSGLFLSYIPALARTQLHAVVSPGIRVPMALCFQADRCIAL